VVPDALRVQARLERQRARWAEAEAALEQALAICARLSERLYAQRIEQALARF